MRSRRFANIGHVWLLVPWVGVALAAKRPIRDNSFLWHVRAGHLQQASGHVLTTDPFSLVYYGRPWRTQSWLLELVYAWLGDGLEWVGSFVGLMAGLTLVAVGIAVYQHTRSVRVTAGLIVWLELLALPYFAPRPVIVSFVFLSLLLVVLGTEKLRWAIPLLLWVWASMHGSFVLGIGLVVLDGLAHRNRRRIIDVMAGGVAVSVTAHGWHVWGIILTFLRSSDSLGFIGEWAPPDVLSRQVLPFTALIVVMFIVATRGGLTTRSLWVVAPFVVFGLSTTRALMPAVLVLMVYMASGLPRSEHRSDKPSLVATGLVGLLVVFPLTIPSANSSQLDPVRFPISVASSLEDVPTFHDDVVGGYLIFRAAAPGKVLFDDRADLYPATFLGSLVGIRSGTPAWEPFFDEYGIEQVLVRRSDGLVTILGSLPGWVEVASDDEFVVWRRTN